MSVDSVSSRELLKEVDFVGFVVHSLPEIEDGINEAVVEVENGVKSSSIVFTHVSVSARDGREIASIWAGGVVIATNSKMNAVVGGFERNDWVVAGVAVVPFLGGGGVGEHSVVGGKEALLELVDDICGDLLGLLARVSDDDGFGSKPVLDVGVE